MATLSTVPTRAFGMFGPELPRLGFGLMNTSGTYNLPPPDSERLALLDHAYNKGQVFWDTGKLLFKQQCAVIHQADMGIKPTSMAIQRTC